MTYIVRPFITPSKSGWTRFRASSGDIQLFVGPASSLRRLAMNVRCSVRATSVGWLRCRYDPGAFSGWRRSRVPSPSISSTRRSFSAAEPSHQTTRSGRTVFSTSSTQRSAGVIGEASPARKKLFEGVEPDSRSRVDGGQTWPRDRSVGLRGRRGASMLARGSSGRRGNMRFRWLVLALVVPAPSGRPADLRQAAAVRATAESEARAWGTRIDALAGRGELALVRVQEDAAFPARRHLRSAAAVGLGTGVWGDRKKVSADAVGGTFRADDKLRPPALATYDLRYDAGLGNFTLGTGFLDPAWIATSADNTWTDGAVVDAHVYAGYTYDYYFRRHGRHGLDGNDRAVRAVVHFLPRAVGFANAFWDPYHGSIFFGDGDGQFTSFSSALDVVAHELSHGVTQFTWNGVGFGETGE